MGFAEAVGSGFRNYAQFGGRALRSEYWYWILFSTLGAVVLTIVDVMTTVGVLSLLFGLATLLPQLAVSVRRLHDIDKSGWFVLLGLIPVVGGIILIIWACQEWTSGPNRFGPPAPLPSPAPALA